MLIGAGVFLVVMFAVWQVSRVMTSAQPLTAEEATQKVQELYSGDIVSVKEGTNLYLITIVLDPGTYEIEIDRETGEIASMTRTKEAVASNEGDQKKPTTGEEQIENPPNTSQEKPSEQDAIENPPENQGTPTEDNSNAQPETPKQLTEKEAIAIALKQLNGEVEDVELEESGGSTYYLVEIEREGEEAEATIQINAISGEVMSVIWDD
ncbi:PepSY domain-containing protein [Mesobacillus maritimus]|uniref:PepSY domain-containing protein n=2 Tax=Mesobacillus maritimus TaxID=1643336 RepID=A0ABS7K429_9BACI|nr:PepSY domain-containing protein [Mesobacillus maritimus]